MKKAARTIVLGVTGSIAAYRACEITGRLRKLGFTVKVIMTAEAHAFVTPLTLQTLSGNKVVTDMFALPEQWELVHTSLAEEADLVLIAPATANIIGKLAGGICDDIIGCVVYATDAPVLIAPAMNEKMYRHPVTRDNIARLKKIGYHFSGPVEGRLACGHTSIGHIADTDDIVRQAQRLAK